MCTIIIYNLWKSQVNHLVLVTGYGHKSCYKFLFLKRFYSVLHSFNIPTLSVSTATLHSNCYIHVQSALDHQYRPIAAIAAAAAGWRPSPLSVRLPPSHTFCLSRHLRPKRLMMFHNIYVTRNRPIAIGYHTACAKSCCKIVQLIKAIFIKSVL